MRMIFASPLVIAIGILLGLPTLAQSPPPVTGQPATSTASPTPLFDYQEVMVPMRDGVRLQTAVVRPHGIDAPLPILLLRTPYGLPEKKEFDEIPPKLKELAADGYIFVYQNLRGRFKSEGIFSLSEDVRAEHGQGTIETRDAWDAIDWLVKNVPHNNGRAGIWGVSYSGYTAAAALLGPHPALKAVSEQASPANQWMNDDDHHYGALRLSYDFEYAVMEEYDKLSNTSFAFNQWDAYQWYLDLGPLSNINDQFIHGKVPYWNDTVAHPNYDAYWKSQAWSDELHRSSVPNLNVAGFWDQEDPWGPWEIFRRAAEDDPDHTNLIVAGPWCHGCWRNAGEDKLGPWLLGHDTGREFRENIQAPFFAYWLHDKGSKPNWRATTFQTGRNSWRTYPDWPPKGAVPTKLYLHADGTLNFVAPGPADKDSQRSYVSDPSNPVPYRPRPISPTYPDGDWRRWESGDQRFVDHRPDVLTYVSRPLEHDLTVTGNVEAVVYASSSGTDSDFIVKLIDVFPENAEKVDWYINADAKGPEPGAYAQKLNGYELPIAMEVRRGRYLNSYEIPTALKPNLPALWPFPLRARDHVFLKGHRIMVQIQSTWFPLIDRNPQTFTPSIFTARASDYRAATQRVYSSAKLPSHIVLPVVLPTP